MLGGPTLISLQIQNAKPAEILERIAQQAHMTVQNELTAELQNQQPVSVCYEKQPLWSVLRSLSSALKTNLGIEANSSFSSSESGWSVSQSEHNMDGIAYVSGPVTIVAHSIGQAVLLDANGKATGQQRLTIELLALVDPQIKLRDGYPRGGTIEIQTPDETALKPLGPEWNWVQEPKKLSPLVWSIKASARLTDPDIRHLGKLRGELSGFVSTLASEKWQIDNPLQAEPAKKSIDNAEFVFNNLKKTGAGNYILEIASYGPGEEADFGWPPRTDHDRIGSLRLLNDSGQPFFAQSWKFEKGKGEVQFRARPTDGNPAKLIWELPTQVGEIQVPFEFADLPLP
jgi:hypothetical protein